MPVLWKRLLNPSLVRRGLDMLLFMHPHLDVVRIDWQLPAEVELHSESVPQRRWEAGMSGPWVLVDLGQPSDTFEAAPAWAVWKFAIWKTTGAVYRLDPDGAVPDDPIIEPT